MGGFEKLKKIEAEVCPYCCSLNITISRSNRLIATDRNFTLKRIINTEIRCNNCNSINNEREITTIDMLECPHHWKQIMMMGAAFPIYICVKCGKRK
ncbi:MAG: hypothetical protein ACTSP9_03105 [Promethearchaeota archaeon]